MNISNQATLQTMPEDVIMKLIDGFTGIQKTNKTTSIEWLRADKELTQLYKEMARRNGELS